MGSATLETAPLVAPRTRALKTWLSPSLCDMFFLAVIGWSFMTSGTGWSRLLWDGDTRHPHRDRRLDSGPRRDPHY